MASSATLACSISGNACIFQSILFLACVSGPKKSNRIPKEGTTQQSVDGQYVVTTEEHERVTLAQLPLFISKIKNLRSYAEAIFTRRVFDTSKKWNWCVRFPKSLQNERWGNRGVTNSYAAQNSVRKLTCWRKALLLEKHLIHGKWRALTGQANKMYATTTPDN